MKRRRISMVLQKHKGVRPKEAERPKEKSTKLQLYSPQKEEENYDENW